MADKQPGSATRPARITFNANEPDGHWQQVGLKLRLSNAGTSTGDAWDVYALDKRYRDTDDLIDKWTIILDGMGALVEMRYPPRHPARANVENARQLVGKLAGVKVNSTAQRPPREQAQHEAGLRLRASYEEQLRERDADHDLDVALALSCDRRRRLDTDYSSLDALIDLVARRVGAEGEPIKPTARALGKWPQTIRNWVDRAGS